MKQRAATLALALIASSLPSGGVAAQAPSPSPSFACTAARTPTEQAICHDPRLAMADSRMARLYAAAQVSAFGFGTANQRGDQLTWLHERAACDTPDRSIHATREDCLLTRYRQRNRDLAIAGLLTAPDLALATLREVDPQGAPLFAAIQTYAAAPAKADWSAPALVPRRAEIVTLLTPAFRTLQSKEEQAYGRSILTDLQVLGPEDALRSEANFAAAIKVLSTYIDGGFTPAVTMPCAAIVRHPGLIEATTAIYGSTLDNFVPRTDCETALPPLPRLSTLLARINVTWPRCEGTIRFAAYRGFGTAVDMARLGDRGAVAVLGDVGRGNALPLLRGVNRTMVDAAARELTAYYMQERHLAAAPAVKLAQDRMRLILQRGHTCD
jgi:uncharacterized protein